MTNQIFLKVLIVDDERRIIQNIKSRLSSLNQGIEIVATAQDGKEALELIEKHRPHIVFTDIKMPVMDGLTLSKEIKRRFPSIFVVIISGFSQFTYAQKALKYGVFNYLLKPIDKEKIRDTIEELRKKIEATCARSHDRSILSPRKSGRQSFQSDRYNVILLCFNNLCNDPSDKVIKAYYDHLHDAIPWENIFQKIGLKDWVLVDEYYVNEKVIVIGQHMEQDIQATLKRFKYYLNKEMDEVAITMCTHQQGIKREDIWLYTQRLRNMLHQQLVPTLSSTFILEEDENSGEKELRYSIKSRINKNLKEAEKKRDHGKIREELRAILEYMTQVRITQKYYEKALISMLQSLEFYLEDYNMEKAEMLRVELFRGLHFATTSKAIEEAFNQCVDNYMKKKSSNVIVGQESILDYVEANFININSVEDVAEKFNYNYTYLSRLFKKITGTSMNKYITKKRIELAKKTIRERPDLTLGEIGEVVGYKDPHYFSRTFKQATGQSPSDYKIHLLQSTRAD